MQPSDFGFEHYAAGIMGGVHFEKWMETRNNQNLVCQYVEQSLTIPTVQHFDDEWIVWKNVVAGKCSWTALQAFMVHRG